jgi:hypothetical protein
MDQQKIRRLTMYDEIARLESIIRQCAEALETIESQYKLFVGPDDAIANAVLAEVKDALQRAYSQI